MTKQPRWAQEEYQRLTEGLSGPFAFQEAFVSYLTRVSPEDREEARVLGTLSREDWHSKYTPKAQRLLRILAGVEPAAEPDPLQQAVEEIFSPGYEHGKEDAETLRRALAARGYCIVKQGAESGQ